MPSPLTPGFNDYRASSSKALPPTPREASAPYYRSHSAPTSRKGSSTYSISKEERPGTPMTPRLSPTTYTNLQEERPRMPRSALRDEALSSKTLLIPPETRSSTSRIPDTVLLRPQLTRGAQVQGASDLTARKQSSEKSVFTEWKAPRYEYSDDEYGLSLPASGKASSHGSWAPSEGTQSAEEIARGYTSMLPALVPESPQSESSFLPSEMSARITDVSDGSLTLAPLVLSGNSEDRKLSSRFDSSDSETESLLEESKPSLKSRAKRAFNSRKASQERKEKTHADLKVSQHGQAGEPTKANHASLQKGIDEMYSTLTGLYSPSKPKMKHDSATSKSNSSRPATPLTAEEKSGRKAWDSLKSPKSPGPKKDKSVGKKLASVLQNGAMAVGLDRGKEQKMKDEE